MNTPLIQGPKDVVIQGVSREQCAYFLLYYMIKYTDHRLRASALRVSWDLNCNFIDSLLDHFGPALEIHPSKSH